MKSIAPADYTACGCIGPQDGDPLCPCAMRGVQIRNGRYVRIEDLGPAPSPEELKARKEREAATSARLSDAMRGMFAKRAMEPRQ